MIAAQHFVSISTGKDSVATLCKARERARVRKMRLRYLFADTGNEHWLTLEHADYLRRTLGIELETLRADFSAEFAERRRTIEAHWSIEERRKEHTALCKSRRGTITPKEVGRLCDCKIRISPPVDPEIIERAKALLVPTGNPFLDLCMLKGRFPSRTAQFCTERLKLEPIHAVINPILDRGVDVVSWIGERAEESPKRAAKPPIQRIRQVSGSSLVLYRPIHKWNAAQTFEIAKRHGLKPNPLYMMGMGRVGCMPCINCGKDELAQINQRFPEEIDRIREWEVIVALVSRRGDATFFPAPMVPGDDSDTLRAQIDRACAWAKTTRGGKQFDLLQRLARDQADEEGAMCESAYGLCE